MRSEINRKAKEAKERYLVGISEKVKECLNKINLEAGYKIDKTYFGHCKYSGIILKGKNEKFFSIKN